MDCLLPASESSESQVGAAGPGLRTTRLRQSCLLRRLIPCSPNECSSWDERPCTLSQANSHPNHKIPGPSPPSREKSNQQSCHLVLASAVFPPVHHPSGTSRISAPPAHICRLLSFVYDRLRLSAGEGGGAALNRGRTFEIPPSVSL